MDTCWLCGALAVLMPLPTQPEKGVCNACALLIFTQSEDLFRRGMIIGMFLVARTLGQEGPAAHRAVLAGFERLQAQATPPTMQA